MKILGMEITNKEVAVAAATLVGAGLAVFGGSQLVKGAKQNKNVEAEESADTENQEIEEETTEVVEETEEQEEA